MNPRVRQLFAAASAYFAAFSVGGTIGYPAVLVQQFKANDNGFQIDADILSWIGSIQGIMSIPSIIMPTLMQIKGRKFSYFITCVILALGWIIIFLAKNISTIIIGQIFLGFGGTSYMSISYCTLSEMVEPKFRSTSLLLIGVFLSSGIAAVHSLGRFFSWSYVDAIMSVPIIISGGMSLFWVESPAWLAYKSKFGKYKTAFSLLRGKNDNAAKELRQLMALEEYAEIGNEVGSFKERITSVGKTLFRRDGYWPCLHTIVILLQMYWGGSIVFYVYIAEMLKATTSNQNAITIGLVYVDIIIIVGTISSSILSNYFDSKIILLASGTGVAVNLLLTSIFSFLQYLGHLSKNSLVGFCCLLGYTTCSSIGIISLSYSLPIELMPVKHKSFRGALYNICCSVFHTSVLKAFPYMLDYLGLIGTFVSFSSVSFICTIYIWKYVPETRHKTLQEIEMSYNKNRNNCNVDESETLTDQVDCVYQTTIYKLQ